MSPALRRLALQRLARLFDLIVVTIIFLAVFALIPGGATWESIENVFAMRITIGNAIIFAVYIAVCAWILTVCGVYRSHRLSRAGRRVREIFVAVSLITAMIFVARAPLELSFATHEFLVAFWLFLFITLTVAHELAQQLLFFARSRGKNLRNVVIIGESREAAELAERFESNSNFGYRVLDIIDPGASKR